MGIKIDCTFLMASICGQNWLDADGSKGISKTVLMPG